MTWLEPAEFPAWRRRLDLHRRARHLTPARRDVLLALLAELASGHNSPTDVELAEVTGYSSRTVRRARADAKALGLLTTTRTPRMVGGQRRLGPNIYAVQTPLALVCPLGGQDGPTSKKVRLRKEREPTTTQVPAGPVRLAVPPAVLEARQQARVAALWQATRRQGFSLPQAGAVLR